MPEAYLDIETTNLSRFSGRITVVGLYVVGAGVSHLVQLVGGDVTGDNLIEALEGTETIFTYNGSRFDLPFIHEALGADLSSLFIHHDLMHDCWRKSLYGGLKTVETLLGIPRELKGMNGFHAAVLWQRYLHLGDENALASLLAYNREDVINLKLLRDKLMTA